MSNPTHAIGLHGQGELAPGLRADRIRVRPSGRFRHRRGAKAGFLHKKWLLRNHRKRS